MTQHKPKLHFNEIKWFCKRYPYIYLKQESGFSTIQKSKDILNTSVWIHTDLSTMWVEVKGITWLDYFLILIRLRNADQL